MNSRIRCKLTSDKRTQNIEFQQYQPELSDVIGVFVVQVYALPVDVNESSDAS